MSSRSYISAFEEGSTMGPLGASLVPIRFASLIVTYRCNGRCKMCNTWQNPSNRDEEIGREVFEKLPYVKTINLTGGEPFVREDLSDIVSILKMKSKRIVISSNGYFTEKIVKLFEKHPGIGIRISIEGLQKINDELRGIEDGFERGLRTLIELHRRGIKDIGFGITVSDRNAKDMIELYYLSKMMRVEFSTAAIHNAYYFHKFDNKFESPEIAIEEFRVLINEQLRSKKVKEWFRAYFNYGLINYIRGKGRMLPCDMGHDTFFLDPYGDVFPCNVLQQSMGNLKEKSFSEIWNGKDAQRVRQQVRECSNNCWMVGSVSEQMKKNMWKPMVWIMKHKFLKRELCL